MREQFKNRPDAKGRDCKGQAVLKGMLLLPQVLAALARAGHHSKVLIADGNHPAANAGGPVVESIDLSLHRLGLPENN
ncbi:MAG: RbsD/FucU domain-containing protein [Planctomycetia bacterium]